MIVSLFFSVSVKYNPIKDKKRKESKNEKKRELVS